MRTSKELQIGKAGEYLVCADLILKGFVAYPTEQGLPYDVMLDIGHRLIRVQVKTTLGPRMVAQRQQETSAYIFSVKRAGKYNLKTTTPADTDLFALVCLDTRKIGYLKNTDMPSTLNFRVDCLKGSYYDEKGLQDYKKVKEMIGSFSQKQIAQNLGLHISQVNRMLQEGYKPYETGARYFSDTEREPEWFTSNFG